MKVIKSMEIPPGTWSGHLTCNHCKAVLQIFENDLYVYRYGGKYCVSVTCCECKNNVDVEKVPLIVAERVYRNRSSDDDDFTDCRDSWGDWGKDRNF